ncbi:hypothetical protein QBC37DRAFT_481852 [Rhypophila decipiens]|uniref:Uncharacterized protein n=1 Tax=Rhypophila decipiens TaxID=261697 RepID=A0AAN7B8N0_9PEZI|nr:hypothetical protein QBC37DRAFT_481852 [Rhypophila decipiens]
MGILLLEFMVSSQGAGMDGGMRSWTQELSGEGLRQALLMCCSKEQCRLSGVSKLIGKARLVWEFAGKLSSWKENRRGGSGAQGGLAGDKVELRVALEAGSLGVSVAVLKASKVHAILLLLSCSTLRVAVASSRGFVGAVPAQLLKAEISGRNLTNRGLRMSVPRTPVGRPAGEHNSRGTRSQPPTRVTTCTAFDVDLATTTIPNNFNRTEQIRDIICNRHMNKARCNTLPYHNSSAHTNCPSMFTAGYLAWIGMKGEASRYVNGLGSLCKSEPQREVKFPRSREDGYM